jgi:membrane-bound ClpP family serine protease
MLDIRLPMGGLFVILGVILGIFGLVADPKIYQVHSLGINVNFGWGCVLLFFGGFMLFMARRAQLRQKNTKDFDNRPSKGNP